MVKEQLIKNKKITKYLKLVAYVVSIFIATWALWQYVAAPTVVDGSSMFPTLANNEKLLVDKLSYTTGSPKRYDIIVFREDLSNTGYYIKRIIGLPGETVFIDKSGDIYINGEHIDDPYGFDDKINDRGIAAGTVYLANDEYFVLGDNRNNSEDSRFKAIGNIRRSAIYGKVFIRLTPFERFGYPDLYRQRTQARKQQSK